jgi:hypothetical protein
MCWDDLYKQFHRHGSWSLRSLTNHLKRQCPELAPSGHNTLKGWFTTCQSLPDKLVFVELAKALELDEKEWSGRWEEWDRARYTAARNSASPTPGEPEPAAPTPRDTRQRTVMLVGVGVLCGLLGAIGVLALSVAASSSTNPEAPSETHQRPACANIVSQVAYVFPAPGDEPYKKIAKYQGDQVVLYADKSDTIGPDGRRYRAVRSPARANPGRSPYSWMLADDLADAPCRPSRRAEN